MYQVPTEATLQPLVGRPLEMIACTANQLTLHFGRDALLTTESEFFLSEGDTEPEKVTVPPQRTSVFRLLQQVVASVVVSENRMSLRLVFESGSNLRFVSGADYEVSTLLSTATNTISNQLHCSLG